MKFGEEKLNEKVCFQTCPTFVILSFMVTTLIYSIIYTMVPRKKIFEKDATYTKMAKDPDSKTDYVNTVYEKMGYIEYLNPKELQEAAVEVDSSVTVEPTDTNKKIYEEYVVELGKTGYFINLREASLFMRLEKYRFMSE